MPSKRERTSRKCSWSEENMKAAITAVQNGNGLRDSARRFCVPVTTLQERVKKGEYYKARMGNRTVFTAEQEQDIANHLLHLATMFYGLTPVQLRCAVFSYAEKLSIPHKFNRVKKEAGKDWMYAFMNRHPRLSFRKPEATSMNRIQAFNKEEVGRFFENLSNLMVKFKFPPTRLFNVDETGITTVNRPARVIGPKGLKQIGAATSGERGKNITVCCCMSASGSFTPPLFIYPRQRMAPALERNGPPGSIYTCTKNGWMTEEVFLIWLKHFAEINNAKQDNPILLILDNHTSHISLPTYQFCKDNGIYMLSIPPHTSHRIQPLDLIFFSSLKKAYDRECDLFLKSRPYEKILMTDVNGIFTKAYIRVSNAEKAIKGFEKAGIFPIDPAVFREEDFYDNSKNIQPVQVTNTTIPDNLTGNHFLSEPVSSCSEPVPGCSKDLVGSLDRSNFNTSFETVVPLPKKANNNSKQQTRRRKQRSEILTSTPMKAVLEEKERKRNAKEADLKKRETEKDRIRKKTITRKVFDSSSEDDNDVDEKNICDDDELDDINPQEMDFDGNEGEVCLVCREYGKNEIWYRCIGCGGWVHKLCSGVETPINYICDFCA